MSKLKLKIYNKQFHCVEMASVNTVKTVIVQKMTRNVKNVVTLKLANSQNLNTLVVVRVVRTVTSSDQATQFAGRRRTIVTSMTIVTVSMTRASTIINLIGLYAKKTDGVIAVHAFTYVHTDVDLM